MIKSYSHLHIPAPKLTMWVKHILTQEEHHKTWPFKEEYFEMLVKNNIEFKGEYLFEFYSDIYNWD